MIAPGAHWGFVLASYGLVGLVVGVLIAWVVIEGRRHKRTLASLESQGIRRRSAGEGR